MSTPLFSPEIPFACVLNSWREHEAELRRYLLHRLSDPHLADDLVQEVFLKAMRYGKGFCVLDNPRAWLFQVARNTLVDRLRLEKHTVPLQEDFPEDLLEEEHPMAPVEALAECLARVLAGLIGARQRHPASVRHRGRQTTDLRRRARSQPAGGQVASAAGPAADARLPDRQLRGPVRCRRQSVLSRAGFESIRPAAGIRSGLTAAG